MKHWRWYLISTALLLLVASLNNHSIIEGLWPACAVLPLWALRVRIIYEARERVTDDALWDWLDRG